MISETPEDSFTEEVEDRLEHLFGEEEPTAMMETEGVDPENYPLRDLKTIILSIDWEINEEAMAGFVDQVGLLQETYRDDKIILVFLQLLGSLGDYIRRNLGQSHPEAFRILNSLFAGLEKIVRNDDIDENEKKRILSAELAKYKQLKGDLSRAQAAEAGKKAPDVSPPVSQPGAAQPDAVQAIEELKGFIHKELEALKTEIKALRNELAGGGDRSEEQPDRDQ